MLLVRREAVVFWSRMRSSGVLTVGVNSETVVIRLGRQLALCVVTRFFRQLVVWPYARDVDCGRVGLWSSSFLGRRDVGTISWNGSPAVRSDFVGHWMLFRQSFKVQVNRKDESRRGC
jgi:hypothetical protein